jgi:hypothetical protein
VDTISKKLQESGECRQELSDSQAGIKENGEKSKIDGLKAWTSLLLSKKY